MRLRLLAVAVSAAALAACGQVEPPSAAPGLPRATTHASWASTGSMSAGRGNFTATLLPNGRVLAVGGWGNSPVAPQASADLYVAFSGAWATAAPMASARVSHVAVTLRTGRLLVVGGHDGVSAVAGAELYEFVSGTWSATGSLATARLSFTATVLQDGKVLVAGGDTGASTLSSCELYDPATGLWTATGSMATTRANHAATLLPSGKVLVTGGAGTTAEVYDPAAGTWSPTGSLSAARSMHTATLLPSGKVLVAGGTGPLASAEIFDPAGSGGIGSFSPTGSLATGRGRHAAALLPNGKVLVVGGNGGAPADTLPTPLASAEIFDPAASGGVGAWSSGGALAQARMGPVATVLHTGKVLVGGGEGIAYFFSTAELYDPATGSWSGAGSLAAGRSDHTATLLASGNVLVAGGYDTSALAPRGSAELHDPAAGTWAATGAMATPRTLHTATLLASGKVLVAGGDTDGFVRLPSAELYDPVGGTWSAAGPLATARRHHTATLLPNGKVLVAGGERSDLSAIAEAEIFDPATGTWSATGSMGTARAFHTATLLTTGRVLVAGGTSNGPILASAELFDPATGTWSPTGGLATARCRHTATFLNGGSVLVAGGNGGTASVELYSSGPGTWSTVASMAAARYGHTATALPSGKVIVAGGFCDSPSAFPGPTEVFEPINRTWSSQGALAVPRTAHTATLLPSGRVLVTGGTDAVGNPTGAERFDEGRGAQAGWTPTISSVSPPSIVVSANLTITGTLFTGISEGSGGGTASSPANIPTVQVTTTDGGRTNAFPVTSFGPGTLTAAQTTSSNFPPGPAWLRVVVNGVPSEAKPLLFLQPVAATPGAPTLAPGQSVTFSATGGTGAGYTWSVPTSNSGGTFTAGSTYRAGATGNVSDTVQVTDSQGNAATATITVTAGLTVVDASPTFPPLGGATLTASGGSGTGYTWTMVGTPASGGGITSGGLYTAGATGSVTDTVRVTDSLGNTATRGVTVTANLAIAPGTSAAAPKESIAFGTTGGSGTGLTWSMVGTPPSGGSVSSIGVYTAGAIGGVSDTVRVTDSLGNVATRTIAVGAGVSLAPTTASVAPRGAQTFTPSGGSGTGFTWSFVTNNSGGSFGGNTYTAGATGSVTDTVRVTDSLGNTATAAVTVTAGLSIIPSALTLASGKTWRFSASGGSGTGFTWDFATNSSNAFVGATTGVYQAGTLIDVTDVVRVTDSLGNVATAQVTVTAPTRTEATKSLYGCSSSGGSAGPAALLFGVAALLLRRPRRAGRVLLALAVAGPLAASAAPAKEAKTRVAVMPIKGGIGIEPQLAELVTDALVAELTDRGLTIITSKDVETALGFERQKQMLGCGQESCLAEIAGALGADRVVFGDIAQVRELTVFSVQLFNTKNGQVEKRFHERMSGGEAGDLLDATERAGATLFPDSVKAFKVARKKSVLTSTARPLALVARGGYDVKDPGGFGMLGLEYRLSRNLRVGVGGLYTGAKSAGASVRAGWYPLVLEQLSVYAAAEAQLLFPKELFVAAHVALGVEWAFTERFAVSVEAPLTLVANAPAEYKTTYFMPGLSASWRF
jgi:hypothetical protein